MGIIIWAGIIFCISQSAMFSGLNLAFFSISRLRLEVESAKGNRHASKILSLRKDSNYLLTTILWGNVGINVLLTLLSNSVLAGVAAFLFSTVLITFFGEIIPQAYFSRHALKTASFLSPALRLYQIVLYPVAKSSAIILDKWLGPEAIQYFQERDFEEILRIHVKSAHTDIDEIEGKGALNFLAIDDLKIIDEGETIDRKSMIGLTFEKGRPIFPIIEASCSDHFLSKVQSSGKKWVVLIDSSTNEAKMVLNSDSFLRAALFESEGFNPYFHCHRPIIIKDPNTPIGDVILKLRVHPLRSDDDVIDQDIMLYWGDTKKIITGSDILGRLLRGIVRQETC